MVKANGKIPLTLAFVKKPRSMALIDGTVQPEGIELSCFYEFSSMRERLNAVATGKYDGGEFCPSTYMRLKSQGVNMTLLPVFYYRGFRQGNIFCHINSGINKFADLKGKTVGVTAFGVTSIVWARGILHHYYGVPRESINWIAAEGDVAEGYLYEVEKYGVEVKRLKQSRAVVWEMVVKGDIDAAIFPGNDGHSSIYPGADLYHRITSSPTLKLIQADEKTLSEYYQDTQIYPIIHTIVVKQDVVDKNPEVAKSLLTAFRQASKLATNYMSEEEKKMAEGEKRFLGRDPYDYTLGKQDRKTLETLMDYLIEDEILDRKLKVESLFAEGTV
jgi:4,5-dihydroxyphthalate decarboxylase